MDVLSVTHGGEYKNLQELHVTHGGEWVQVPIIGTTGGAGLYVTKGGEWEPLDVDPPTNFTGVADSVTQTTLTWVDSTHPYITLYDVYYNLTGVPVTVSDTLLAGNITAGTQQVIHTLDATAQGAAEVFYGLIGKSS
jgi:hypothetical protein